MDLATARFAVAALMFAGGALFDLRTRRVPNRYWLPFAAAAAGFVAADLLQGGTSRDDLLPYAVALAACGVLFTLWRLGLFGGADAKGLMVVAFLLPVAPVPVPAWGVATVPVLDTLLNGSLLTLLVPVACLAWNLARGRWGGWATFLGVPLPLERARQAQAWPLQRIEEGRLGWRYWHRPDESLDEAYDGLAAAGATEVWVTPKVPFMVPLALGLGLAWWTGNLVVGATLALTP